MAVFYYISEHLIKLMQRKLINGFPFVNFAPSMFSEVEMMQRTSDYYTWLNQRRTVRDFSDKPIPQEIIKIDSFGRYNAFRTQTKQ